MKNTPALKLRVSFDTCYIPCRVNVILNSQQPNAYINPLSLQSKILLPKTAIWLGAPVTMDGRWWWTAGSCVLLISTPRRALLSSRLLAATTPPVTVESMLLLVSDVVVDEPCRCPWSISSSQTQSPSRVMATTTKHPWNLYFLNQNRQDNGGVFSYLSSWFPNGDRNAFYCSFFGWEGVGVWVWEGLCMPCCALWWFMSAQRSLLVG